jgi:hypothetical protein
MEKIALDKIDYFFKKIQNGKRKTSAINDFAVGMINYVSKLYQQLYNLSDYIQQANPTIQDGSTLKSLLSDVYEQTTLPQISQFMFLIDLLKAIMSSFLTDIKKRQKTEQLEDALCEIVIDIEWECTAWEERAEALEVKPLFYVDSGKPILHDDASDIIRQFGN